MNPMFLPMMMMVRIGDERNFSDLLIRCQQFIDRLNLMVTIVEVSNPNLVPCSSAVFLKDFPTHSYHVSTCI